MRWIIIIRSEAEHDISEAFKWYQNQREGLGLDFLLRIEAALDSIAADPFIYVPVYKDVRRKLVRRFPFNIFYFVENGRIIILAVIHAKRAPGNWKIRRKK